MIRFQAVTKTYHTGKSIYTALKGIDIEITKGELVAIVGPSGSGKSTIMNILGLLDKPTTGDYFLNHQNTNILSGDALADFRNRHLGFIFQQFFLLPKLSAIENVLLPLSYRQENQKNQQEQYEQGMMMLESVGMASFAKHRPTELSGGQQQRIAIARALIGKPTLVLADEPTGALDTNTSAQIMTLLKAQREISGATVVVITHAKEIAAQCERVITLRDGCIEAPL